MNNFIQNKKSFSIKIRYWILTGVLFFSIALNAQYSKEIIDSLEMVLQMPATADSELFLVYKKLSNAYLYSDIEKSLEYARMGVRLAEKKNNSYQIAEFYYNLGNSYYYANRMDSALYYYEQSSVMLKQAEKKETNHKDEIDFLQLRLYRSIGVINDIFGKYDWALDNYYKALSLAETINEPDEILELYLNLANSYLKMSNHRQAELYYLKGENLSREVSDSIGLADAYLGLSTVFYFNNDYPKALEYGEESCRIFSVLPDVPAYKLMSANQKVTEIWLKILDYNKALEYAKEAVKYAQQTGIESYIASALYSLSSCYLKQGKYKESEETAFQALETDSTDLYINSILYGNIALSNIWSGNNAKGVEYFGKTTNAIRAYSNLNFQSSLSEMEVKYETEKKEFKITALEGEKRLMTGLSIAVGIVLLLALAASLSLWRWTVQKKRIAEQQRQLAEQSVKQLEQEKQLIATQAVLDGETQERARLARDLHDGLGSMLTGAKLSLLEMKKDVKLEYTDVERFDKALGLLDRSVNEMRRVAHHLMPDSLSRFGLKPAVSDFCSVLPSVRFAYYGNESRLDSKLEVMIYRSIHELVNNALKHAGADKIIVQIIQEPDRIAFTVQDDGCGFDPSTSAQGMGLQNIRTRVASYNGIIYIDSKPGEGTEVNVELKIMNYEL